MEKKNNQIGLVIKMCEQRAERDNMAPEQKRVYINDTLMKYLERYMEEKGRKGKNVYLADYNMEQIIQLYEETWTDFSKDEFLKYLISHTSNEVIIFNEKKKIEKKLGEIDKRIAEIDKVLGCKEEIKNEKFYSILKQELEDEKRSLQELQSGLRDLCNQYNSRLPISLGRDENIRREANAVGDEKRYNDIVKELNRIKQSTTEDNLDEEVFKYYRTLIGVDTKNWEAFWNNGKGVSADIYAIFVRYVPSFEGYLKRLINNLKKEANSIKSKKEELEAIYHEVSKFGGTITVKGSPNKSDSLCFYDMVKDLDIQHNISDNLGEIEKELEEMISDESKETPAMLNKELMKFYFKQTKKDSSGRYIFQDMYDLFVSKYPPFEEYLQGWSDFSDTLVTDIAKLRNDYNDICELISNYNVHYQGRPDGYSTEDKEMF